MEEIGKLQPCPWSLEDNRGNESNTEQSPGNFASSPVKYSLDVSRNASFVLFIFIYPVCMCMCMNVEAPWLMLEIAHFVF